MKEAIVPLLGSTGSFLMIRGELLGICFTQRAMRYLILGLSAVLFTSLSPLGCTEGEPSLVGGRCGNGEVDSQEVCDGSTSSQYCSADCLTKGGYCGDGLVEPEFGEECDTQASSTAEGGAGGMSSGTANKGCKNCVAAQGYLCDAETNSCEQTGVDSEEKAVDHIAEVCSWFLGISGGENFTFECSMDDVVYRITTGTQEDCELLYKSDEECTIGELESWARSKNRCELYSAQWPCDS